MKKLLSLIAIAVSALAVTGCHSSMDSSGNTMNQSTNSYSSASTDGKNGKAPNDMQTNAP